MKKHFTILSLSVFSVLFSQQVTFNKIEKVVDHNDGFLYLIETLPSNATYLGEIEVVGAVDKEEAAHKMILSKAKEIGANTFKLKPFETIDESETSFNANHFLLSLFYIPPAEIPNKKPFLFLFGSNKNQTIRVNDIKYEIKANGCFTLDLNPGAPYDVSTGKFLGTTLRFEADDNSKYILCEKFNIKANDGLSLKSGDLVMLDKSYGDFLHILYCRLEN